MASIKYGCITPNVSGREYPVAASQFFYHDGVNAVYLDGSGHVTLALTATTTLKGIAIVPKGRGAGSSDSYWKSNATAAVDKIFVITDPNAEYLLPAGGTAAGDTTVTAAMAGNACDLTAVNDGTVTWVDVDTSTTDVFLIQAQGINYGGATTDVVVKINPAKVQADT